MPPQVHLPSVRPVPAVPRPPRRSAAFTLVEILLVVSLLSLVALTLFQALSSGLKVWAMSRQLDHEEDVQIFLDKLEHDLHNSFVFSALPFEGKESQLTFPTKARILAESRHPDAGAYIEQIGLAQYRFDRESESVVRRQAGYGRAVAEQFAPEQRLAGRVRDLRFGYYFGPKDWSTEPRRKAAGIVPVLVRVDVKFVEKSGRIRDISRLIHCPMGKADGSN